jgi:PTH1 family peptidyl-tRNA hydrolase
VIYMYIIAGLGNPGRKYINTRHNVGFDVIDLLAEKHGIRVGKVKFKGSTGTGEIAGQEVLLLKPATYMNLSGMSVLDAVEYYRIDFGNLLVIYDDADLETGRIRIRRSGSSGTHNGMKSIIYQLQTEDFPRLRLGIGPVPEGQDLGYFVLDRFSKEQKALMDEAKKRAVLAVETYLRDGLDAAMSMFNG